MAAFGAASELAGRSVACASLDSGRGHPDGEAGGVVVASLGAFLVGWHAAEFGGPEDERVVEESQRVDAGKEGGGRALSS